MPIAPDDLREPGRPAFTVVVCTRDRPAALARCLAALARLDHGGHGEPEVVVVDSASRDSATREIVAATPFRYVREEMPGLDRARNRGAAEACHGLIAYADDDTEPDPGWLRGLAAAFADPRVAAVAGRVLAAQVDTPAQRLFERYGGDGGDPGGMDKGPVRRDFHRDGMRPWELVATQRIGVGANLAVRKAALEAVGGFDPELDAGTPARGAGDLDFFHRLLRRGFLVRYEPSAVVRHHHRRETAELRRQLRDNGCSFGVYLIRLCREGDPRGRRTALAYALLRWFPWLLSRVARGLAGLHPLPLPLLWDELAGALEAPLAWRSARAQGISYAVADVELSALPPVLPLPLGRRGVGLLLRRRGRPVGFALRELPPGSVLTADEVARIALREVGAKPVEEALREELAGTAPAPGLPPVTAAVCTRDRPEVLARCLAGLLAIRDEAARRGLRFEVLVVDNAPSDERTAERVAACPGVRYVREPRPGLDFARNRALHEASGELLAYLDDDVTVDPGWLDGLAEAWAANPDAAAFTGLVLPFELESEAQVLFERRGGFRRGFDKTRYGQALPGNRWYPCGAGIFGAGANMAFRCDALLRLGGFDEALDTGPPLPGGGDLDIFYRMVRAGHPIVYEPRMLVFHQHRRELAGLARQYRSWGQGFLAFLVKSYGADPGHRAKLRGVARWWFKDQAKQALRSLLGRHTLPPGMVLAELRGGLAGLAGTYPRSLRRSMAIRNRHREGHP
jgi:GT2 family glycosyltransferase